MEHGVGIRRTGSLVVLMLLLGTLAQAADTPPEPKPLLWAGDAKGGAPYVSLDPDHAGKLVGFEVELRDALQHEIGRSIEFKQYSFSQIDSGLLRGDFDLAMNGVEGTPDRQVRFRFSRPYYIYSLQLVCRRADNRFQSLDDCKKQHVAVGTLANSAAARLLDREQILKLAYDDQTTPYKDLAQNRIDAVLLDLPIAVQYTKRDPSFTGRFRFVGERMEPGHYVIAFRKDDEQLARQFDTAIEKLFDKGTLRTIYERWGIWNDDQEKLPGTRAVTPRQPQQSPTSVPVARDQSAPIGRTWLPIGLALLALLLAIGIGLAVTATRRRT